MRISDWSSDVCSSDLTGSGMGATLNTAVGMGAYALTDRATWIAFGNKGDFQVAVEGDQRLFNQYGIIQVSPEKCPRVKADLGQAILDWVHSDEGQSAIGSYKKTGQKPFSTNRKGRSRDEKGVSI